MYKSVFFSSIPPTGQSGVCRSLAVGFKPWPGRITLEPGRSPPLHLGASIHRMSSFFFYRAHSLSLPPTPVSFFLFFFNSSFFYPLLSFSSLRYVPVVLKGMDGSLPLQFPSLSSFLSENEPTEIQEQHRAVGVTWLQSVDRDKMTSRNESALRSFIYIKIVNTLSDYLLCSFLIVG